MSEHAIDPAQANKIREAITFLSQHAPFDRMSKPHLVLLASRVRLGFFAKGELVLGPEHGQAQHFYIVMQGSVLAEQAGSQAQLANTHIVLMPGESFPMGALLANRPVVSSYHAREDAFIYELPAKDFQEVIRISPQFLDFCTRRLANLLEESKRVIQAQYSQHASEQQPMNSPLSSLLQRRPVSCSVDTSIGEVLSIMHKQHVGSMVITTPDNVPIGIFTIQDVLDRIAIARPDPANPIASVMSGNPITLPPHVPAYEAALAMARHGIRHIVITDAEGKLAGMVSERDLFSLQRISLGQVSNAIRHAPSVASLKQIADDVRHLAKSMLAQGLNTELVLQFVSTLKDLLAQRVIELQFGSTDLGSNVQFCWLALGSSGRFEQSLHTDQDNALIFAHPESIPADQVRSMLLPLAQQTNLALAEVGFAPCGRNNLAGNPQFCLSMEEWHDRFTGWIDYAEGDGLVHAEPFFDFRPRFGEVTLAERLRHWLTNRCKGNRDFLRRLTSNTFRHQPPLEVLRLGEGGEEHYSEGLDLKRYGTEPFVDAARILALGLGVETTTTTTRLREAGATLGVDHQDIDAWLEGFNFIQLVRLRQQIGNTPQADLLNIDSLNDLDRRILKEAFRQGRKVQSLIASRFA